jgi:enoyl-CoA hydratase/carnithine racemase
MSKSAEKTIAYETLSLDVDGDGILTVWLKRPERLNAFTVKMANELVDLFSRVNDDDGVRSVIVTGTGKAFCAGMDLGTEGNVFGLDESLTPSLAGMKQGLTEPHIHHGVRDTGGRVTLAIYDCRKPVIAAINGAAVGIGATMTLAMDFRLATPAARIGFVFSKLGIVPEACSSFFLPRIVGLSTALEWTYSGDLISAENAMAAGLIRSLHAPEDLLNSARTLARLFTAGKSPVSVALIRQLMLRNMAATHPMEAHWIDSLAMYYTSIGDGKEGVEAFMSKRLPTFEAKASEMPEFYREWTQRS